MIRLTADELELAQQIAANRTSMKRARGVDANLGPKQDGTRSEVIGACGEIVAARWLGQPAPEVERPRLHGDGGIDFNVHGMTIDVKTTGSASPALQIFPGKNLRAEIFLLVRMDLEHAAGPHGAPVGWLAIGELKSKLMQRRPTAYREGWVPSYRIPREELWEPDDLLQTLGLPVVRGGEPA